MDYPLCFFYQINALFKTMEKLFFMNFLYECFKYYVLNTLYSHLINSTRNIVLGLI